MFFDPRTASRRSGHLATLTAGLALAVTLPASAELIDLTIDGQPFAMVRGEVSGERMIEVPGASTVLATWNEVVDGETVAHFGVSLDGRTLVRVAPTTYELGLRHGAFDPLDGVPPVESGFEASADMRLHLVQFVTQPLEAFEDAIVARGGVVRHYVAELAYLVEMDAATRAAVAELPYVRWIGPYHPAYRLEEVLLQGTPDADAVYNVQVLDPSQKAIVAGRLAGIGVSPQNADAGKVRLEAPLTASQLAEVATWDEVLFIDRWSQLEPDIDLAREFSGANYVESIEGYTGAGVRGEVYDIGFNLNHQDFASRPLIQHGGSVAQDGHGASTSGIIFGDGTASSIHRGLLPDGQGIVSDIFDVPLEDGNRYEHTQELLEPPYSAVFQSSSVGSSRTSSYSTISADHDALLFDLDLAMCQSQSNSGGTPSRPQAWSKNVISVGGVNHRSTLDTDDDCWCSGASVGPASDGRIKPDLHHFYDSIRTVGCCGSTSYDASFCCTSGATPIVCGYVGLFHQMWSDGIFGNEVSGDPLDVFGNRPHMTTAKAMMINTAAAYDFSGTTGDLRRTHQGWGKPDVARLYDVRDGFLIIDETDLLSPFETLTYEVEVASGQELRVTMTYADPAGNPAVQSQHRINDLDLRVTSPLGFVYWGNAGLMQGNTSTPLGGPDTKNTVENVFLSSPTPGTWTIAVRATELIQDGHVETPMLDADFALVANVAGTPVVGVDDAVAGVPARELLIRGISPSRVSAQLDFHLATPTRTRLTILDASGRVVTTAFSGLLGEGNQTLTWDGTTNGGHAVPSGVYFARIEAGERRMQGKVMVLR